jgi:hypothetical protein
MNGCSSGAGKVANIRISGVETSGGWVFSYFVADLGILTDDVSPLLTSTNPQKFIVGGLELIIARNLSI